MNDEINVIVLAYLGDSVYELEIRKRLLSINKHNVDMLQKKSIDFVSAKAQSNILKNMTEDNFLTSEELEIIRRVRNYKRKIHPKNTDIMTYKYASAFEALLGYHYINNNIKRIDEIMDYIWR